MGYVNKKANKKGKKKYIDSKTKNWLLNSYKNNLDNQYRNVFWVITFGLLKKKNKNLFETI